MQMNMTFQGLVLAIFFVTSGSLRASEVLVGESLDEVMAEMGQPRGFIRSGTYLLLDYEHGKVELKEGKVVRAELMTDEQLAAHRDLMAKRNIAAAKAAASRRAALIIEGTRIRNEKLADPAFMSLPASEQVAYWRWFRQAYPVVDVGGEYAVALQRYETELAVQSREAARAREIAALEDRVAEAERAAADAQWEAQQAWTYRYYYTAYPSCYVKPSYPCAPSKPQPQPLPVATPHHSATIKWAIGPSMPPPASTSGTTIGWLAWER